MTTAMRLPFRWKIPVVVRISSGLIGLMVSVLLLVSMLGLFPDSRAELVRGRVLFCESAAVSFSMMAQKADVQTMRAYLRSLSERNDDVRSMGVRREEIGLVVEVGEHAAHWNVNQSEMSGNSQIWVRLYSEGEPWGTFEATYAPLENASSLGILGRPEIAHGLVVAVLCMGAFYVYLRIVLRHLDPSQVIPKRVREALDTLAEGLLIIDRRERVVLANRAFETSTGTTLQQVLGRPADRISFVSKDESPSDLSPWREALRSGQPVTGRLLGIKAEGFEKCTFSVSASPILDDHGNHRGVLASFEDVTRLEQKKRELTNMVQYLRASSDAIKQQNRELERLASRDPLTGCLNRRSFFECFDSQWRVAQRYKQPLSVLMVDLDFFKTINDNYGHIMGDEVLRKVGETLQEIAREADVVCRYGGEEFAALLPQTDSQEAMAAAERIRWTLENLAFPKFSITVSVGVATRSDETEKPEELLDQADKCLYSAKRAGRNQVVCWDEVADDLAVDRPKRHRPEETIDGEVVTIPYHAVTALISALAYRDQSTAAHSRRVADMCVATAEGLMSLTDCYALEVAALLHDIGKVGVPDNILLKPGPLTPEEWEIMRRHDTVGVEIVRTSFSLPKLTAIVEHHRAHFGNPEVCPVSPTGNNIPLGSRILAIADAYDSITNDQVFRDSRSQEEAFAELRRCAGSQFDPELVERFITTVLARPAMQQAVPRDIPKDSALAIGLQIEQLSRVLDAQDFDALDAMSHRLVSTARKCGAERIGDKASELTIVLSADRDPHSVIQVAIELLDLCRSAQQSFLDSQADEPAPLSSGTALSTSEPVQAAAEN